MMGLADEPAIRSLVLLSLCRNELGADLSEEALERATAVLREWVGCGDRFCGHDELAVIDAFLSLCRAQRLHFRRDGNSPS